MSTLCMQCCQFSDFVAIFSEFSDPSFSEKRLATNLGTFSGVIGDLETDVKKHFFLSSGSAAVSASHLTKHSQAAQSSHSSLCHLQSDSGIGMFTPPRPDCVLIAHALKTCLRCFYHRHIYVDAASSTELYVNVAAILDVARSERGICLLHVLHGVALLVLHLKPKLREIPFTGKT